MPPAAEPFSWRVSVAHIEASGPFSDFAGYERKMLLLQGLGLDLSFADGRRSQLRKVGDWVEFDGAISTHCDLLDGPCVDWNLITAKALTTSVKLEHVRDGLTATAAPGETVLVLSLQAAVTLGEEGGASTRLNPWDLAVVSQATVRLETAEPGAHSVPVAVFIATISQ